MATKQNKSKKEDSQSIQRGGNVYKISKSTVHFVVKRSPKTKKGELLHAMREPDKFPGLKYQETESYNRIEVFSVDENFLDSAMDSLRKNDPDTTWCAHAYHFPGEPENLLLPTDSIFVRFQDNADHASITKLLEKYQLEAMPSVDSQGND